MWSSDINLYITCWCASRRSLLFNCFNPVCLKFVVFEIFRLRKYFRFLLKIAFTKQVFRDQRVNQTTSARNRRTNSLPMFCHHQTVPIERPGGRTTHASFTVQMVKGRKCQDSVHRESVVNQFWVWYTGGTWK